MAANSNSTPTPEQIAAAYELVQNAEKAVYQTMLTSAQQCLEAIEASMANLPSNRTPTPAGLQNVMGWTGTLRSMISTAQNYLNSITPVPTVAPTATPTGTPSS